MFKLTPKGRENTSKIIMNLITVDAATLLAGNILNPLGFLLPIFIWGCILLMVFYIVVLWLDR